MSIGKGQSPDQKKAFPPEVPWAQAPNDCVPQSPEFHMATLSIIFKLSSQHRPDESCKSLSFAYDKLTTHHFILLSKGSKF